MVGIATVNTNITGQQPKKKLRYFQINLTRCAGDNSLIDDITKALKEKGFEIMQDSLVLTIKEKPKVVK